MLHVCLCRNPCTALTCVDIGLAAAGAAAAAFGLDASSTIPAITMVFCMVDGAKDWKVLHDKRMRADIQQKMRDVLINTLMAVKGGYMCRLQEDEFKYMVAFPDPEVGCALVRRTRGLSIGINCFQCIGANSVRQSWRIIHHMHVCSVPRYFWLCLAGLESLTRGSVLACRMRSSGAW